MKNIFAAIAVGVALFSASSVLAQDAKLVEAAKKEGGKVVVYGSLEADTTDAVVKAFEKKTGLGVEYWRASTTKGMDRAAPQFPAQKAPVDVLLVHAPQMQ